MFLLGHARTRRLASCSRNRGTGATSWCRGGFSRPSSTTTDRCRQSGGRIRWSFFFHVPFRFVSFHFISFRQTALLWSLRMSGAFLCCYCHYIVVGFHQTLIIFPPIFSWEWRIARVWFLGFFFSPPLGKQKPLAPIFYLPQETAGVFFSTPVVGGG